MTNCWHSVHSTRLLSTLSMHSVGLHSMQHMEAEEAGQPVRGWQAATVQEEVGGGVDDGSNGRYWGLLLSGLVLLVSVVLSPAQVAEL